MKLTIWDILAMMTLLALLITGIIFLQIFADPYAVINPFPPPTLPPTLMIPSATPTLRSLPPTWTHTPELSGLFATLRPTSTPLPTATDFRLPTFTPTRTQTQTPTNTPTRTNTPKPTKTRKPPPTNTPITPSPTNTPIPPPPTNTPIPPSPTNTPIPPPPTNTPIPPSPTNTPNTPDTPT